MEWLAIKVLSKKEYLDHIAQVFNELGSGGAVVDDPDLIESHALSGKWDAWEFPEIIGGKKYSVTGYFPVTKELENRLENLTLALEEFKNIKKDFSYKIIQTAIDEEDWANSWKKYFKVLKIGERTVVRPTWEKYDKKPGEVVIDLDPGMAFGTGSHATTSQAMELTEKYLKVNDSVIDVGSGSGIISIQAGKLGASLVKAFDYDPVAVKSAERNVHDNNLAEIITVKQNDLLKGIEDKADLIIANIVADIIITLIPQLDSRLNKEGTVILSGIIEKRLKDVQVSLKEYNFEIIEKREKEGWYALAVKRIEARTKLVATYTLGCKVNQTETETIEGMLQENGYEIVTFDDRADLYIINTCTVTSSADRKSRQIIRRARSLGKDSLIIIMGCYAQVSSEDILKKLDVDLVIGNTQRLYLVDHLNQFLKDRIPRVYVDDIMKEKEFEQINVKRNITRTRAFLKIQEGCQQFCSYCIIPYTRGPIRSKSPDDLIKEIIELEKDDFHEVVLTGIHIGAYGQDFPYEYDFEKILRKIIANTDKMRIRISSIEPTEVNEGIAKLISQEDRICNHLHIPLQSGDDFILKKMNRPYDTEYFRKKIEMIRKYNPEISITTDIMVGFPYEKEENAKNTLKFAEEMKFSDMHVFRYSPRKNTPASKFPEQVALKDKKRRSAALISLGEKMKKDFLHKFLHKEMEVLLEQKQGQYWEGHTSNYLKVLIQGDGAKNLFSQVYIEKVKDDYLIGKNV